MFVWKKFFSIIKKNAEWWSKIASYINMTLGHFYSAILSIKYWWLKWNEISFFSLSLRFGHFMILMKILAGLFVCVYICTYGWWWWFFFQKKKWFVVVVENPIWFFFLCHPFFFSFFSFHWKERISNHKNKSNFSSHSVSQFHWW